MDEISVTILKRKNRRYFYMQYRDPETGDKVVKSTNTAVRRDAERTAAKWETEIRDGRDRRYGKMLWDDFRQRYEDEVLESLAERTYEKAAGVFDVFERRMKPQRLSSISADVLSRYQKGLRDAGRAESTIKGHLRHILAALSWAKSKRWLPAVPNVKMPKRARKPKVMKGRPITLEEFERMLDKVTAALRAPLWEEKKVDAGSRNVSSATKRFSVGRNFERRWRLSVRLPGRFCCVGSGVPA